MSAVKDSKGRLINSIEFIRDLLGSNTGKIAHGILHLFQVAGLKPMQGAAAAIQYASVALATHGVDRDQFLSFVSEVFEQTQETRERDADHLKESNEKFLQLRNSLTLFEELQEGDTFLQKPAEA